MRMNRGGKVGVYFVVLIVGLVLGAIAGAELFRNIHRIALPSFIQRKIQTPSDDTSSRHEEKRIDDITVSRRNAIVRATQRVEPCVVGIVVTQLQVVNPSYYYEDFFDLFFAPRLAPKYREVHNMGSGLVISKDGLILTNNHVVEGAEKLYINFPDGRQYEGVIVGTDPYSDLAVVRAKGKGFEYVEFGNSDDLMIGEWVIAIGNPFLNFFNDAQPTVTVGVVSALNRNFAASDNVYYQNMIQTDAAINPGNSGGPLLNALGEVIGVNAFIYTGSKNKGSIGIGFAIPINRAKRVAEELITYGKRRQIATGISVQDLDRGVALALGLERNSGVVITDIKRGSPGGKAGLRVNDVIVRMAKRRIHSHLDLDGFFINYFPGDTIAVQVMRNGKKIELDLVLEEYGFGS